MDAKTRIKWAIVGLAGLCVLLYLLRTVLTPVFLSLLLAYLLDPLIDKMEARRIPRTVAIFIFVGVLLSLAVAVLLILIPIAQREISSAVSAFPYYFARFQENVTPWLEKTFGTHLPTTLDEVMREISANLDKIPTEVVKPFAGIIKKIFSNTLYIVLGLLNLVVVPVFTFYFLRDFDKMKSKAVALVPVAYRNWTVEKFRQVDKTLGAFLRGQLTVCTVLAVLYSVGLVMTGIDMAVVIGVSSGYLFIVPYLGTIFGIVTASIMALLKFHDFWHVLAVWGVFAVVQFFESYILTPRVVGEQVGLKPVSVIIALLIGGSLFGFLGILIAVPTAAVLKIFADDLLELYRKSEFYLGGLKKAETKEGTEEELL